MKCGLLSLALLGATPASGCWLRNSADGTRTELDGKLHWGQHAAIKEALAADGPATTVRAKRISGKRALATACSDNKHFSECSRDRGSAIRLERCLKKRSGNKLSATCQKGLQTWKQLLAETAPNARIRKGNGPGRKKAAKKALARSALPGTKDLVELGGGWVVDPVEPHHAHHEGLGVHQGHPHPHHHRMGPHHHAHAPPGFFEDDDIFLLEKRRPSMFSVLTDWIFGDSSSSDSLDSFPWDASSSTDEAVLLGTVISSSATFVDAGFFPAGYGIPPPSDAWRVVPRDTSQPKRNARKGLRGNNKRDNVFPESSSQRPVGLLAPFFDSGADAPGESNGALPAGFFDDKEEEYFGEAVEEELFQEYGEEGAPSYPAGALEGMLRPDIHRMRPNEGELDIDLEDIELADIELAGLTEDLRRDNLLASPHKGYVLDREMEPEWEWESLPEEDFPMFAGGPRVHPKRHHRGDHIRFRNPLPEDFENQRAWLSDSFDADGDGPDLIEAILAFFFFIGAMTLMLLPFFLLGRALKRMVRNGGGDGSDAEAPDGYYALPEDDSAAAAAAGMVSADDDDDSIVVTGTPVNPPPSVHL